MIIRRDRILDFLIFVTNHAKVQYLYYNIYINIYTRNSFQGLVMPGNDKKAEADNNQSHGLLGGSCVSAFPSTTISTKTERFKLFLIQLLVHNVVYNFNNLFLNSAVIKN